MASKLFLLVLSMTLAFPVKSQHLIGSTKDQVIKDIKIYYPDFAMDNSSVNHTYKYLKYIDKFKDQTLLVFLSEDDICSCTKLVSDYSNLLDVKKELSAKYKSAGKDKWKYVVNREKFLVELKREKWFFSVFTSKEK